MAAAQRRARPAVRPGGAHVLIRLRVAKYLWRVCERRLAIHPAILLWVKDDGSTMSAA